MELKEWMEIFRRQARAFWMTVLVFLVAGIAWQVLQPQVYKADLTLNVTRKGNQQTDAYKYDDFYRLQADERFADTVVRWLGSPRVVSDINTTAHVSQGVAFKAERLSSQMIRVRYATHEPETAHALSRSLLETINSLAQELDKDQHVETWFVVAGDEPVVWDGRTTWAFSLGIALALGVFFGFWAALLRHYFLEEKTNIPKEC